MLPYLSKRSIHHEVTVDQRHHFAVLHLCPPNAPTSLRRACAGGRIDLLGGPAAGSALGLRRQGPIHEYGPPVLGDRLKHGPAFEKMSLVRPPHALDESVLAEDVLRDLVRGLGDRQP